MTEIAWWEVAYRAGLIVAVAVAFHWWMTRLTWWTRTCPHSDLNGIYGDEINAVGGYRLRCNDCGQLLRGPVRLAAWRRGERAMR